MNKTQTGRAIFRSHKKSRPSSLPKLVIDGSHASTLAAAESYPCRDLARKWPAKMNLAIGRCKNEMGRKVKSKNLITG